PYAHASCSALPATAPSIVMSWAGATILRIAGATGGGFAALSTSTAAMTGDAALLPARSRATARKSYVPLGRVDVSRRIEYGATSSDAISPHVSAPATDRSNRTLATPDPSPSDAEAASVTRPLSGAPGFARLAAGGVLSTRRPTRGGE